MKNNNSNIFNYFNFIIGDILAIQTSLIIAYIIRHGISSPYQNNLYRNMALFLIVDYLFVIFFYEGYKKIFKRGYLEELINVVSTCAIVSMVSVFFTFVTQTGELYSRITFILFSICSIILTYITRIVMKKVVASNSRVNRNTRSIVLITNREKAYDLLQQVKKYRYENIKLSGFVIIDDDMVGKSIDGVPVVSNRYGVKSYLLLNWVDEVFLLSSNDIYSEYFEDELQSVCNDIGAVFHKSIYSKPLEENLSINNVFGYTVLTQSVVNVSIRDIVVKRLFDVLGGIVGCIITLILTIIIGPIIYISSPGNIFFSQKRVGKNGKVFKIYKFRSMYMDAEERKAELMKQNKVKDGMMFKMDKDPRIIKGIGTFIRKLSIDEFPQFLNVLKGDMSLVGTRPPTVDEWEKYNLYHKKRLALKPGLTGMWQVSGRSNITDFEEVVKLDVKYINNFSLKLDIKILFKTILVIFKREGSA